MRLTRKCVGIEQHFLSAISQADPQHALLTRFQVEEKHSIANAVLVAIDGRGGADFHQTRPPL
jgi:hypothetical protein